MTEPSRPLPGAERHPEAVRAELARTRARMSQTIDEIEDVLLEKKETIIATAKGIRQRIDPFYKAREKPLAALGIALGSGLLLGLITGGRKRVQVALIEAPTQAPLGPAAVVVDPSAELWERRARRLLRIARRQQEELAAASEPEPEWEEEPEYEHEDDYPFNDAEAYDEDEAAAHPGSRGLRERLRRAMRGRGYA